MSARLGMNEIPYVSWKGKTFVQITSILKRNKWFNTTMKKPLFFTSPPVKQYRREIASTTDIGNCIATSIDEINRPGGSIVNPTIKGIGTVDINYPNNITEQLGQCKNSYTCAATNARNRVRSSGMIKRKFNASKNNDTYYTNVNQYLVSRNKTFQQNQYNYIRVGDPSLKPGDAQTVTNIYSAQGLNHCQQYHVAVDTSFGYQWLDSYTYPVSVPSGYYSLDDINQLFKDTMTSNEHYFINKNGYNKVFLLNIAYDTALGKIELQTFAYDQAAFAITYSIPINSAVISVTSNSTTATYVNGTQPNVNQLIVDTTVNGNYFVNGTYVAGYTNPTITLSSPAVTSGANVSVNFNTVIDSSGVPVFIIKNNEFQKAIGFYAGNYPNLGIGKGQQLINQSFLSAFKPGILPTYVPIYFKPNNPQFSQQGGVTASSLITRVRYNTITNNTAIFRKTYGSAVANSLAYGVPEYGYTKKDKIGYPNKCTPIC